LLEKAEVAIRTYLARSDDPKSGRSIFWT